MDAQKHGQPALQERTNRPQSNGPGILQKFHRLKQFWDDNERHLPRPLSFDNHSDERQRTHSKSPEPLISDLNPPPTDIASMPPTEIPPSPVNDVVEAPQIQLLQKAIDLLKTHAEEASLNIVKLRTLLADRDTEPATYKSLQRQRWLEERRELDVTKALWHTVQGVSAIMEDDASFFKCKIVPSESESVRIVSEITRHRTAPPIPTANDAASATSPQRVHRHFGLIPLTLAMKADMPPPPAPQPKPSSIIDSRSFTSTTCSEFQTPVTNMHSLDLSLSDDESPGPSGTVTIYRPKPDRTKDSDSQRIKAVAAVAMPDYVADLLSEFEAQSSTPLLPLVSPTLSRLSTEEGSSHVEPPETAASDHDHSLLGPTPETQDELLPASSPTSPRRMSRMMRPQVVHKSPSKRFSGLFAKKPLQVPSSLDSLTHEVRMGTSIDFVVEEGGGVVVVDHNRGVISPKRVSADSATSSLPPSVHDTPTSGDRKLGSRLRKRISAFKI